MSFGQIGDCVVLGLPGNPVAVFVCFLIYVRPVLTTACGRRVARARVLSFARVVRAKEEGGAARVLARKADERTGGRLSVAKFARDGSGLISSMREADGLIEVAEDVSEVREGDMVDFIPFTEFGLPPS